MLKHWRLVLPAHTLHSTLIPVVRIAMEHIIRRIEDRILVAPCSCICIHLHTLLYHCCLLGKSGFKLPHNLAHIPGLHHFCLGRRLGELARRETLQMSITSWDFLASADESFLDLPILNESSNNIMDGEDEMGGFENGLVGGNKESGRD
nr:hypothetical protein Iba_chr13bCG11540 [Ipomoea batatas]